MRRLAVICLCALMTACGVTVTNYAITDPAPNTLRIVRYQDFWGTLYVPMFFDADGRVAFPKAETGSSVAGFTGTVLGVAVGGAGLGYIGHQLPKINTGTSTVTVQDAMGQQP